MLVSGRVFINVFFRPVRIWDAAKKKLTFFQTDLRLLHVAISKVVQIIRNSIEVLNHQACKQLWFETKGAHPWYWFEECTPAVLKRTVFFSRSKGLKKIMVGGWWCFAFNCFGGDVLWGGVKFHCFLEDRVFVGYLIRCWWFCWGWVCHRGRLDSTMAGRMLWNRVRIRVSRTDLYSGLQHGPVIRWVRDTHVSLHVSQKDRKRVQVLKNFMLFSWEKWGAVGQNPSNQFVVYLIYRISWRSSGF